MGVCSSNNIKKNNSTSNSDTINSNYNSNISNTNNCQKNNKLKSSVIDKKNGNTNFKFETLLFKHQENFKNIRNMIKYNQKDPKEIKEYYLINKNWIENYMTNIDVNGIKVKYESSNDIPYPKDFQIIEQKILDTFINKDYFNKIERVLVTVFKDYIIIQNEKEINNNKIYYICSLKEVYLNFADFYLNVDYIFSFNKEQDFTFIYQKIIKTIIEMSFREKEENKVINIIEGENRKVGFYICFPVNYNEPKTLEEKINYYFEINRIYEIFIYSIYNIENIEIKDNLKPNKIFYYPVFIVKGDFFEKVIERIYYNEYNDYIEGDEEKKKEIYKNLKEKESGRDDSLKSLLIDINLSYEECLHLSKEKKTICLINEDFCKAANINRLKYKEHLTLLLIIDGHYHLLFRKENKIIKILKNNETNYENFWDAKEIKNDNENFIKYILDSINKGNQKELFALLSPSIIKKLLYIYYIEIYFLEKIKGKKFDSNIRKVILINKNWLDNYKKFYNYSEVIKLIPQISTEISNENDINKIIERIFSSENFKAEIPHNSKFPENLKNLNSLLPEESKGFYLINNELLDLLIKEENAHDSYHIQFNNNSFEIYNCLLGNNYIILNPQNNPNNLLIYSLEIKESNNYDYKLKYIFQFINSSVNEMKEIINCEYLIYYLFKKNNIDISKYGKQTFPEGMFTNYNEEKIGILSYNKPPLIGLANIGATCYMNATLQSLSNIDTLTNYFLIFQDIFYQDSIKYDLSKEYAKLIKNLWDTNNTKKYFEPYDFKNKISQKNPLFSGIAANDSKDLILFIFQELHNELNIINPNNRYNMNNNDMNNQFRDQRNEKEEYKLFIKNYYSFNNSIIQKIFYGEQETINYCHNCKATIYNFNIYSFLIFPLEKVRLYLTNVKKDGFDKVTLEDCFLNYISEEIMSGDNQMYCNYCHRNSNYSMINKIYTHPEVLVIILNRGKGLEFDVEFEYPENFILNNYINFENNDNYQNYEIIEYELISVITHLGESSMSGHFIAYCKSPIDNKWYKYNDAIVSESGSDFMNSNNDELKTIPYVLFYKIKKQNLKDYLQINSQKIINENINNNSNSNIITIYFDINDEKQLYIDIDENKSLNDAIILLIEKSKLPKKNYICYKDNRQLDGNKSIKENLLINEDHIKII